MISLYEQARESFATAGINWQSDVIKISLIDVADYTVNLITDRYLVNVPVNAFVSTAVLTNKTANNGECKCDDVTFTGVVGDTVEGFIVYKDTTDANTSPLILYNDGFIPVYCSANAGVGDTTIKVDPLLLPIKAGETVAFTGGVTVTLTANAAIDSRELTVQALTSGQTILSGETGTSYIGGKLNFTPNSGNAELVFGGNYLFKI